MTPGGCSIGYASRCCGVLDCSDNEMGTSKFIFVSPHFYDNTKGRKMAKFHDAMNDFGSSVDLPDDFKSALANAYDEDFSSYEAKVSDLENQLTEKDGTITQLNTDFGAQISSLKSANYDLLRAVPKDAKVNVSDNDNDNLSDHDITIADLFSKK